MNEMFAIRELARITLFFGAYGSGKSEISINFASWLRQSGHQVSLCDLDIINPFFRSADARQSVEADGIRLIAPVFAGTNVDVPAVPAAIYSVFDDPSCYAVLDIGGEDMGARVIATLGDRLSDLKPPSARYMVVNPFRPFSRTPEQIVSLAHELTLAAGLAPTGLVHNANLIDERDAHLLTESWPVVQAAANRLGLPVLFAAAMDAAIPPDWSGRTPDGLPLLHLQRHIEYLRD